MNALPFVNDLVTHVSKALYHSLTSKAARSQPYHVRSGRDLAEQGAVGATLQMKREHRRQSVTFVSCNICSASLDTHSDNKPVPSGRHTRVVGPQKGHCPLKL